MDTWLWIGAGAVAAWILRNQYVIMAALKGQAQQIQYLREDSRDDAQEIKNWHEYGKPEPDAEEYVKKHLG